MTTVPRILVPLAAVATAALAFAGFGLLPGGAGRAEAQGLGLGPPPACQCSATTAIPGLSTSIANCVCGGVACVVSQSTAGGAGTHQLQCVK